VSLKSVPCSDDQIRSHVAMLENRLGGIETRLDRQEREAEAHREKLDGLLNSILSRIGQADSQANIQLEARSDKLRAELDKDVTALSTRIDSIERARFDEKKPNWPAILGSLSVLSIIVGAAWAIIQMSSQITMSQNVGPVKEKLARMDQEAQDREKMAKFIFNRQEKINSQIYSALRDAGSKFPEGTALKDADASAHP
jgi:chaperonin cofactor prefoldin